MAKKKAKKPAKKNEMMMKPKEMKKMMGRGMK